MKKKLLAAALVVGASLTLTPQAHAASPDAPVYGDADSIVRTAQAVGQEIAYGYSYLKQQLAYGWYSFNGVGF